jgi:hypothetical protein
MRSKTTESVIHIAAFPQLNYHTTFWWAPYFTDDTYIDCNVTDNMDQSDLNVAGLKHPVPKTAVIHVRNTVTTLGTNVA